MRSRVLRFADNDPKDEDADVSDVGSSLSGHPTAHHTSPLVPATAKMQPNSALHLHSSPLAASALAPAPAKKTVGKGRKEELSGEGSQSEGQDSPT